jgi:hypothetical protein
VWVGVPCDLAANLGRRLKDAAAARGLFPVVAGFTNDYIGYCVAEETYRTAEYEALMAFNGPRAGELIVERLINMLDVVAHGTPLDSARGRQHTAHSPSSNQAP